MLRACPKYVHHALLQLKLGSGQLVKVWLSSGSSRSGSDETLGSAAADALLERLRAHKRDRRWRDALNEV
jgi:hypothetical protein